MFSALSRAAAALVAALRPGPQTGARIALGAILALAAALRLWHLDRNGIGTAYYAAGVRSQLESWHNLLFNAFDPAGFVSLDKPPVAFWIQAASARLFGFSGLSILVPQALEGIASVAILHRLVARGFGPGAGLLAALFLAVTPVSVAVDRSGNTDSALVLFLLLAAWALVRAIGSGRARDVVLAAALVAIAFNVKMLAAFIAVPAFAAAWAAAAPGAWQRRAALLGLAGLVLAAGSAAWIAVYDATPAADRPYAGSSATNSMAELVVGHNGLERFSRAAPVAADGEAVRDAAFQRRFYDAVPAGPFRLAARRLAGQVLWLLPFVLLGLGACAAAALGRATPREERAAAILWGGWAAAAALTFSATGGIFHAYYLSLAAAPFAAVAAIGAARAWAWAWAGSRRAGWRVWVLPGLLAAAAGWQGWMQRDDLGSGTGDWRTWLVLSMALAVAAALVLLAVTMWRPRLAPVGLAAGPGLGLAALLVLPAAWALSSVLVPGSQMLPSADMARFDADRTRWMLPDRLRDAVPSDDARLAAFVAANRHGERFALAAPNARLAAPIILRAGVPVMAMGGFSGADPIVAPEGFARMAADGEVRFVLVGGRHSFGPGEANEARRAAFVAWVLHHGTRVDPALWRSRRPGRLGVVELYDLRPGAPLAAAAR